MNKTEEVISSFRCIVCESTGQWVNVDEFRFQKAGMHLCTVCGFVTYPELCSNPDGVADRYRGHEYREAPTVQNLFTCERKIHYHGAFLSELFDAWEKAGKQKPRVLEIGAAFGMVLNWIRGIFPKARLAGTELTLSFRRNAWHMYKVQLDEKPDFTVERDLIISYKVAEHIPNVDVELRKYAEALAPDGRLYISVPVWFYDLQNSGMMGFDLNFYYDKNHVNVWSRNLFEQLLKKAGLEIVKQNHVYYGATYLCKRNDELMSAPRTFDDPVVRREELRRIHEAAKLGLEAKWQEAYAVWPNYPEANVNALEATRNKAHQGGFEGIVKEWLEPAVARCPHSSYVAAHVADWYMRYEKYEEAIGKLNTVLDMRPNDPGALQNLAVCFRNLAVRAQDEATKIRFLGEARKVMLFLRQVSEQQRHEAITWEMQDNARLPMPSELASPAPAPAKT